MSLIALASLLFGLGSASQPESFVADDNSANIPESVQTAGEFDAFGVCRDLVETVSDNLVDNPGLEEVLTPGIPLLLALICSGPRAAAR